MSMMGQSRSLGILSCMPKIKEPMMKRSIFSFFDWNRKSKIEDPVIISSLSFTAETKISSDSFYPTILNLPHRTLTNSVTIHKRNKQFLITEIFETIHGLSPSFMNEFLSWKKRATT